MASQDWADKQARRIVTRLSNVDQDALPSEGPDLATIAMDEIANALRNAREEGENVSMRDMNNWFVARRNQSRQQKEKSK